MQIKKEGAEMDGEDDGGEDMKGDVADHSPQVMVEGMTAML